MGGASVVAGSFFMTKASSSNNTTQIITDTSRYHQIRTQLWSEHDKVNHFPLKIPADAQQVSMAYSANQSQGNSFFQIRLKQSAEKIQKLRSHYQQIASHKYYGGDTNSHINQANGIPTTFFYTSNSGRETFPSSYEILVLKAQDQGQSGFKWNRGYSYGVAVDSTQSEIVYWAEKW
ncbi:hypothetical protein B6N60_02522 [Richelia sinica FACHB-800]|uniref:Uncharacterized protein n=1 Tax=Richelia sinica FACHB-800 TaxID=1357546 RepID=A0A975T9H2_9NOST|nr:hypothetical protein B6N60_02522 [Richelia sinica FACHB-800]